MAFQYRGRCTHYLGHAGASGDAHQGLHGTELNHVLGHGFSVCRTFELIALRNNIGLSKELEIPLANFREAIVNLGRIRYAAGELVMLGIASEADTQEGAGQPLLG